MNQYEPPTDVASRVEAISTSGIIWNKCMIFEMKEISLIIYIYIYSVYLTSSYCPFFHPQIHNKMFSSASRFALRAASRSALRTQQPNLVRHFAGSVSLHEST